MAKRPKAVEAFLAGTRFAVAGVSRDGRQPANAIFRKLRASGYDVVPVNPAAKVAERATCYPDLRSIPGTVDGVVIVTCPDVALDIVRDARDRGISHVWFHRSFGRGSVSEAAVSFCRFSGMNCIVGGCPMMYCEPIDIAHRCMCWWLGRSHRVPV
jgi:predicted CoA-binding protein